MNTIVDLINHNNKFWLFNKTMDNSCRENIVIRQMRTNKFDETILLYKILNQYIKYGILNIKDVEKC